MKLSNNMNKKYTQISIYVIVTAVIIYCLSRLADNFPVILNEALNRLSWFFQVVKPVILGFVLAYLVEPVIVFFQRQYGRIKLLKGKEKRCRGLAILTLLLLVVFALILIVSLLVSSVTNQIKIASFDDLIVLCNNYLNVINDFSKSIMEKIGQLNIESKELSQYLKEAGTVVLNAIQNMASGVVGSVANIGGSITTFVFSIIIAVYFLVDGAMIMEYLSKVSRALLNKRIHNKIKSFLDDADQVFSGYIRGQLMDAFVMMILISLVLSAVGVKFGIIIGICAGVGNLIPYCGPFVAYAGTGVVCLLNGQYKQLVIAIVLLFIIQTIDGNYIGPRLLSQSINIHPLIVIISLFFGSAIGGLLGMLLAVPVGAFIKVLFVKFIDRRLEAKV